ncbi:7-carboxy-7-deazaguanine synthase [Desulfocicer vacuolatum DSM 3385]|uniref:7-carboxy-7-deazaguanine synthase n=1 Tax=Desulfocicer vacuolatum DSM 3385 TaxID=1121400 RepID=A0A1W2A6W6_9BACT|nr:7-carboxy-7-deazaguanine synthase QueE [Desulfocicer vacuolatum]SMC56445.1 7-carboxy-7-deazaguanine synthase [Desulfocicer vacuolatum DSM 3385]
MMIEVSEIFTSIQGEGPFLGRPASFLRLSKCLPPLCPWCDTRHAWEPGEWISIKTVAAGIVALENKLCVITGGEPYLQWNAGLNFLEKYLIEQGLTVQYETSGKVLIPSDSRGFKVCSPKYLADTWHFIPENTSLAHCFKFVVKDDFTKVNAFIKEHHIPANKVWVMPMGALRHEQLEHSSRIWDFCVKNHYNFSPRLHTLFFNNQQGV